MKGLSWLMVSAATNHPQTLQRLLTQWSGPRTVNCLYDLVKGLTSPQPRSK